MKHGRQLVLRIAEPRAYRGDGFQPEATLRQRQRGEPVELGLDLGAVRCCEVAHCLSRRMHRFGQRPGRGTDCIRGIVAMLSDQFHQRRANDDTVRDLGYGCGLLGRAHPEADRDGQVCCRFQPRGGLFDRAERGLLLAGDPGN